MCRQRQCVIVRPQVITLVSTGLAALALAWSWVGGVSAASWQQIEWSVPWLFFLTAAVVVVDRYPIHVQRHTKISIMTVPLYLLAVLFPQPLAVSAVGVAVLLAELAARQERDSLPSDIVVTTSRWVLIATLSTWIAHLPLQSGALQDLRLVGAAIIMGVGDLLTGSLHTASISNEPPIGVLLATARAVGVAEGVQYLIGILGAVAAAAHPWAIVLLIVPCVVVYLAFKGTKEIQQSTRQLLESMADAVDLRDSYTGGHSRRVADYCTSILRELQLAGPEVDLIVSAARVHDIGKIGIPDHILNKPGRLTDEERIFMESHAVRGADLLGRYPDFTRGVEIVRHHHERWDGRGYPAQLAGYAIPFGARVIAVADSYDAMTSDRPYRRGMPPVQAVQILREGRGEQWDPAIVEAFLRSIVDQLELQPLPSIPETLLPAADTMALEVVR